MKLNEAARAALRDAGVSQAAWARHYGYADGRWFGDACGCPDDRCIGDHHDESDECQCLPVLLANLKEEAAMADIVTGPPVIPQAARVEEDDRSFVLLPGGVPTINGRKLRAKRQMNWKKPTIVGVDAELDQRIQLAWDHANARITDPDHGSFWSEIAGRNEAVVALYDELFRALPGGDLLSQLVIDARSYRRDLIKHARSQADPVAGSRSYLEM